MISIGGVGIRMILARKGLDHISKERVRMRVMLCSVTGSCHSVAQFADHIKVF